MINDELYGFILNICKACNVKLIALGDPKQLKPVKQKTLSKALYGTDGYYELTKVERTNSFLLLNEITTVRNAINNHCFTFETKYDKNSGVMFERDPIRFQNMIIRMFKSENFIKDKLYGKVMTSTNKSVNEYNQLIRQNIFNDELEYHVGEILMGYNTFGSGFIGPLILNSGDYELTSVSPLIEKNLYGINTTGYTISVKDLFTNIISPSLYILSRDNPDEVFNNLGSVFETLRLDAISKSSNEVKNSWKNFYEFNESFITPKSIMHDGLIKIPKTLDYGYAITIHKSQGGQFETAFIDNKEIDRAFFADKECLRQMKYVSISRAKNIAIVFH